MNIVWNIETVLQSNKKSNNIKVGLRDRWIGVKLSKSKMNSFKGVVTANITKNNMIFLDIPVGWYMIEN